MLNKSEALTLKVAETVEYMLAHVDDGADPTDALAKAASELDLLPDFVKLAANAYNKGMHQSQLQNNDNILDKLASFPMADAERAIEMVWGSKPTEKVSSSYLSPPTKIERRYHKQAMDRIRGTTASIDAMQKLAEETKPTATEPKWAMERAYNKSLTLKRASEEAQYQARAARERLLGQFGRLGDYFKQASFDRLHLGDVQWHAEQKYGEQVTPLFDYVRSRNKVKAGAEEKRASSPLQVDETKAPWNIILACLKAAEDCLNQDIEAKKALDQYMGKSEELLAPYGGIPGQRKEAAGFAGGTLLGAALGGLRNLGAEQKVESDKDIGKGLLELEDPDHQARLRGIRAEAMLQDFMANDEVISGYDPEEVLRAYNDLAPILPQGSTQPALMRSAIRERLTTQPATFDVGQLADIEDKLRRQKMPPAAPVGAAPALPLTPQTGSIPQ